MKFRKRTAIRLFEPVIRVVINDSCSEVDSSSSDFRIMVAALKVDPSATWVAMDQPSGTWVGMNEPLTVANLVQVLIALSVVSSFSLI
ncbi:hypothetical protein FNV43_RR25155 [Rhamnella rubrinervis]|uniref:Uncharacterized protein n=1 Tax=Rhamnella rubrinervis TaxID=2594499 RepID=A0A8K0GLX0_9ROSA|nr:hypothetical protein FNV43_RR25155 [Rhamnella rubrinervis]